MGLQLRGVQELRGSAAKSPGARKVGIRSPGELWSLWGEEKVLVCLQMDMKRSHSDLQVVR